MYNINSKINAITHGGSTHRNVHMDEFLSCCLVLHLHGDTPIFRRNPTEEELNDSETLVVDVGMKHQPELGNFDHHQLDRNAEPACALSMLVEHWGYADVFAYQDWYAPLVQIDSKGPFVVAKKLGLAKFPFELVSPLNNALLEMFSSSQVVSLELRKIMVVLGKTVLKLAVDFSDKIQVLHSKVEIGDCGVGYMLIQDTDITGLQQYHDKKLPDVAISICHDDRGEGWTLYRFNDHPSIDFSKLSGHEEILFAHNGGFIAKTKTRLPLEKVLELVKDSCLPW